MGDLANVTDVRIDGLDDLALSQQPIRYRAPYQRRRRAFRCPIVLLADALGTVNTAQRQRSVLFAEEYE